jgi:uncharacterized membrane protein YpjA
MKEQGASWLKALALVVLILGGLWVLWALVIVFAPFGID